ncbi:putative tRNA 2'-phosphotransferase [Mortierella sp. GBAus27b]|nr:putative tRNA 2'-phosphotransferase [Mortierella sp. GBAus27b]
MSSSRGSTSTRSGPNTSSPPKNRNRGPRDDTPEVRLSKALSWLLRHNAVSQGVAIRPDGYVKLDDVLKHSRFKGYTKQDVYAAVNNNSKKRFQILEEASVAGTVVLIRAVQGHSIEEVAELGFEEITDAAQIPTAVHGTMFSKWRLIHEHGLSKMNRNHIHLAIGLPGEIGVISGMRNNTDLYIYINTAKAIQDGIKFYKTSNNVILSDGKDGDGIIPPRYFVKVQRSSGELINVR